MHNQTSRFINLLGVLFVSITGFAISDYIIENTHSNYVSVFYFLLFVVGVCLVLYTDSHDDDKND